MRCGTTIVLPLAHIPLGWGPTQQPECREGQQVAQRSTCRSSCSSSKARCTMGPRTAYSTLRTHGFMVSRVNTFPLSPFLEAWL